MASGYQVYIMAVDKKKDVTFFMFTVTLVCSVIIY